MPIKYLKDEIVFWHCYTNQRLSTCPWAVTRAEATKPPPFRTGVGWITRDQSSLRLRPRMILVEKKDQHILGQQLFHQIRQVGKVGQDHVGV